METVAIVPLVLLVAAVGWQLVLTGHTLWLCANAARAAARADLIGKSAARAARSALPRSLERGLTVTRGPTRRSASESAYRSSPTWRAPVHVGLPRRWEADDATSTTRVAAAGRRAPRARARVSADRRPWSCSRPCPLVLLRRRSRGRAGCSRSATRACSPVTRPRQGRWPWPAEGTHARGRARRAARVVAGARGQVAVKGGEVHGPVAAADADPHPERAARCASGCGGGGAMRPPPAARHDSQGGSRCFRGSAQGRLPRLRSSPSRGLLATAVAAVESSSWSTAAPSRPPKVPDRSRSRPVVCVFGLAVAVASRLSPGTCRGVRRAGTGVERRPWACEARPGRGIPLATHAARRRWPESWRTFLGVCSACGGPALSGGRRRPGPAGGHRPVPCAGRHRCRLGGDRRCGGGVGRPGGDRDLPGRRPALARVATDCVARVGPPPVVVLNRAPHDQPGLFALPNSPLGARLALGRTGGTRRAGPRGRRAGRPA